MDRLDFATISAYLNGAHLTRWHPPGHEPVLFMSERAVLEPGKAIRGGVPICFPWFGGAGDPSHGFARISPWSAEIGSDDRVSFSLIDNEATRDTWPHAFAATFDVTGGDALKLRFSAKNTGDKPFTFELALHTYLAVADVRNVTLTGFADCDYIDQLDDNRTVTQQGEPTIAGEVDRIYQNHTADVTITDPGLSRCITVKKTGSRSTVLWNPHIAKAKRLDDFGDDEWPQMLCVETANIGDHAVSLAPGASHETTVRIEVDHV
ncbi:MAG: D-hexose-6-phosphate mutarotase [Planctomycetota bacterium]